MLASSGTTGTAALSSRLDALATRPHRNKALHWAAFAASMVSLVLLVTWVIGGRGSVSRAWVLVDIGLSAAFALEFFTRSGLRWDWGGYVRTHLFDFVAVVPALVLAHQGLPFEGVWVWFILVARGARSMNRALGDGFVQQNVYALAEGFEEEITDRVLLRILSRVQVDLDAGGLGHKVAEALVRNKGSVLQRVRDAHPREGVAAGLARITGLDAALERAEERTYDAIVEVVDSPEVDRALRDVVASTFTAMREEIAVKAWRQRLGFGRGGALWSRQRRL